MKLRIGHNFANTKNLIGINIIRLLDKNCSTRLMCNVTNIPKTCEKVKPNLVIGNTIRNVRNSKKSISFYGYLLLSIPVGTFVLGAWQIQRRKWKLDLIEKLNSRINMEPIELPENLEELQSMEYYPIKVKGRFIYEKECFIGLRSLLVNGKPINDSALIKSNQGQAGYHVITPFKLTNRDLTILVNRGWVPKSYKYVATRQEQQTEDETEIIGILRSNETRPQFLQKNPPKSDIWHYRDLNEMAKRVDASPIYIEMIYNKKSLEFPIAGQTKIQLRNEHMSYIITWFSLSVATGYIWYKRFLKHLVPF